MLKCETCSHPPLLFPCTKLDNTREPHENKKEVGCRRRAALSFIEVPTHVLHKGAGGVMREGFREGEVWGAFERQLNLVEMEDSTVN